MRTIVRRQIEVCPHCGKWQPWVSYARTTVRGQKRVYARCKRCGTRATILYCPPTQPDNRQKSV